MCISKSGLYKWFKTTTKIDKQALNSPNLISGDFTSYKPNEI